jgi:hypothetical protein
MLAAAAVDGQGIPSLGQFLARFGWVCPTQNRYMFTRTDGRRRLRPLALLLKRPLRLSSPRGQRERSRVAVGGRAGVRRPSARMTHDRSWATKGQRPRGKAHPTGASHCSRTSRPCLHLLMGIGGGQCRSPGTPLRRRRLLVSVVHRSVCPLSSPRRGRRQPTGTRKEGSSGFRAAEVPVAGGWPASPRLDKMLGT